jgi:hypothetical protein
MRITLADGRWVELQSATVGRPEDRRLRRRLKSRIGELGELTPAVLAAVLPQWLPKPRSRTAAAAEVAAGPGSLLRAQRALDRMRLEG